MHNRSTEAHFKKNRHISSNHTRTSRYQAQHEHSGTSSGSFSILLALPSESIIHITSFLDPFSLISLAGTNKHLYDHVKDDNTWRRAFFCQCLGIGPESDLSHDNVLLLRRTETTWKKEFIMRYNYRRRWERSRCATVTHVPHNSPIAGMHLMSENALLTSSLQYGIVSRSFPLTGKILKGFLDASGTLNGLGIGNPNAEFSPDLSASALASDGGTAKVVWGYTSGEIAVTTSSRTMDYASRAAAKWARCQIGDAHHGVVDAISWDAGAADNIAFVTGGADGRAKLWDARTVKCLWTSEMQEGVAADPCVKIASDAANGIVAAVMRSGEILTWSGLPMLSPALEKHTLFTGGRKIRIPAPILNSSNLYSIQKQQEPIALSIDVSTSAPTHVSLLVCYDKSHYFYRYDVDFVSGDIKESQYGDSTTGYLRSLYPSFAKPAEESSFVLVGDELGCVGIYSWSASSPPISPVACTHKFEALEDGAVTALAHTPSVIAAGSTQGTVKVFDSMSFRPLRTFSTPLSKAPWEPVSHLVVEADVVVASVDSKVLAWKAGPTGKNKGKKTIRSGGGGKKNVVAKWQQQMELHRDIKESREELAYERAHAQRTYSREKQQLSALEGLGLNEREALDYILMLSREEEDRRQMSCMAQLIEDEGVFNADFDDLPTPSIERSSSASTSTSSPFEDASVWSESRSLPRSWTAASSSAPGRETPVSPRYNSELVQTESSVGDSPVPIPSARTGHIPIPQGDDFPSISPSHSSVGSMPTHQGAWSTPLSCSASSSSGAASKGESVSGSFSGRPANATSRSAEEIEDEELRFAIELSLVEARSRGEDV